GVEVGLALYDAYDTYYTLTSRCSTLTEKFFAGGLFLLGAVLPAGGYSAADDLIDVAKVAGKAGPKLLGPGTNIGAKIEKQMAPRGWNRAAIDKVIATPHQTRTVRDIRHLPGGGQLDAPATAYINRQGHYVIRNDQTGDIVQLSNRHDLDWGAPWD
ncbi:MAG: colicin E5-related ribonuclease, partial [Myxococcaceae bacterium]